MMKKTTANITPKGTGWSTEDTLRLSHGLRHLNLEDPLNCLLLAVANEDFGSPALTAVNQHLDQATYRIRKLRHKISLIASTIAAMKLCLKLNFNPSFITINSFLMKKASNTAQNHIKQQIQQITQTYLEHLTAFHQNAENELNQILPNSWATADSTNIHKRNIPEWKNISNQTQPDYIAPTNRHTKSALSIQNTPLCWSKELATKFELILSSKPTLLTLTPQETKYADKDRNFTITKLSNNTCMIQHKDSKFEIPPKVIKALGLGLKFTPEYPKYPLEPDFAIAISKFRRRISWNHFFLSRKHYSTPHGTHKRFLPAALRQNKVAKKPPPVPSLNTFCSELEKQFKTDLETNKHTPNQKESTEISQAIKFFWTHANKLILKPADKGGCITIMDHLFYEYGMNQYLEDTKTFHCQLPADPTPEMVEMVKTTLNNMMKNSSIGSDNATLLFPPPKARCPNLYGLPKLHKETVGMRPIVSGNGHPTEFVSIFIDHYLQPYVRDYKLYLKDSTQLLCDLNRVFPPGTIQKDHIIFTLDVVAMYPNIPLDEAEKAVLACLNKSDRLPNQHPNTIYNLTKLVLRNNYFSFNGKYYLQKHGIAMGTPCACVVSDIFICLLMDKLLAKQQLKPAYYKQYRDDGIGIWPHGQERLIEWFNQLNQEHPTIKFTIDYGRSVHYLDLILKLDDRHGIKSETYNKPTDTFDFLHQKSNHPPHCGENIAISQAIRHARNCSNYSSYQYHTGMMKNSLIKRGYSHKTVEDKTASIQYKKRNTLLKYKTKTRMDEGLVPLVIPFAKGMPDMKAIFKKQLEKQEDKYGLDQTMKEALGKRPLIGNTIQSSIGKRIIRANYPLKIRKEKQNPTTNNGRRCSKK